MKKDTPIFLGLMLLVILMWCTACASAADDVQNPLKKFELGGEQSGDIVIGITVSGETASVDSFESDFDKMILKWKCRAKKWTMGKATKKMSLSYLNETESPIAVSTRLS